MAGDARLRPILHFPTASNSMPTEDWRPTATWPRLALRAELLTRVREIFRQRGFMEVETPLLSADVVVDRHLEPYAVHQPAEAVGGPRLWLQTSPEFAMKRLLAAGGEAIYQVTRAFRQGESGALHNREFTMVEWYRRGDDLAAGMRLLSDVAEELLGRGPAELVSYGEAFVRHAGIDPHHASTDELRAAASRVSGTRADRLGADRDLWLNLLLVELVEPRLGIGRPTILFDYPASQAALARVRPGNPPVAERFELYVNGIELANGYHELTDPEVLRERNRRQNALRELDGKQTLPEDSRLLAAMEHGLPACAGVALGFDRVVMIAAGASSLAEVMAFPAERA